MKKIIATLAVLASCNNALAVDQLGAMETNAPSSSSEVDGQDFIRMWQKPMSQRNAYWAGFVKTAKASPYYTGENTFHFCEKQSQTCTDGLFYKNHDNKPMLIIEVTNLDGEMTGRGTCYFPRRSLDVRICQNFDAGNFWRDVKDVDGKWETVERQEASK